MTVNKMKHITILSVEASEADVLERAASICYLAGFAVSDALVAEAKSRSLLPLLATKFETIPDRGAKALIGGMEVRVGSPKLLVDEKIPVPVSFAEEIKARTRAGESVIVVLSGRSLSGAIALSVLEEPEPHAPVSGTPALATSVHLFRRLGTWFKK